MMILALDLGKFNTMCCFFDSETRKQEFIVAATQREYLTKIFKLKHVDVVVMEACGPCFAIRLTGTQPLWPKSHRRTKEASQKSK